jgi:hypothetical protein
MAKMDFVIEFLLKNKQELDKLIQQLQEQYQVDIDTDELDEAFADLEDQHVSLEADGSQAINEANDVEAEVDEIPDEHETDISATDSASSVITAVSTAYLALVNVAGQVKNALGDLVEASNVQEDAEVKLAAALKNTGQYSEDAYKGLLDYASALQEQTRYGDEAILSATTLAQNIGRFAAEELPAVQKAAIGLAEAYEMDLNTAMKLIGRAAKGQTQTLTRYGIVLDMTASKEEQFAQLLEQGADKFKLAKDAAASGAGELEQYGNLVGDLKESLGTLIKTALLPVISNLKNGITVAINFFQSLTETSLQTTIRELEDLGVSVERINKLKQLSLQAEVIKLNQELQETNKNQQSQEEIVEHIEDLQQKLNREAAIYAGHVQEAAKNSKAAVPADALNTTGKLVKMSKEQVEAIQKELAEYTETLMILQKIEVTEKQIEALNSRSKDDTTEEKEELIASNQELDKMQHNLEALANIPPPEIELPEAPDPEKLFPLDPIFQQYDAYFAKVDEYLSTDLQKKKAHLDQVRVELESAYADNLISEEEYHQQRNALNIAYSQLYLSQSKMVTDQIAGFADSLYAYKKQKLDNEMQDEIDAVQQSALTEEEKQAKIQNIKEKYAKKEKKAKAAMKPVLIAEAVSNTALGVAKALGSTIPPFNFILAALVAAQGAMQVATIKAQKYAKGGIPKAQQGVLQGPSHSQGGILLEAEGGEPILTKGVSEDGNLLAMASMLNQMAGGDPLPGAPKSKYAAGGVATQTGNSSSDAKLDRVINILTAINQNIVASKPNIEVINKAPNVQTVVRDQGEAIEDMQAAGEDV